MILLPIANIVKETYCHACNFCLHFFLLLGKKKKRHLVENMSWSISSLGKMKKSISVFFTVYLTRVFDTSLEAKEVLLWCCRSIMALTGQVVALLGTQATAPGSIYRRETQSITFSHSSNSLSTDSTLTAIELAVQRGMLVTEDWLWNLLEAMSDMHRNTFRWRNW